VDSSASDGKNEAVIYAILRRYVTNPRWFLMVLGVFFAADLLIAFFIGDRLVRWEIDQIREAWNAE
jgi:hypothetical protein